jgi:hypothetical protein
MSRKQKSSLVAAMLFALAASPVFADDSSMSRLTGDSYAFFNDLDYSSGKFNTARAPRTAPANDAVANSPIKQQVERRILLADRPLHITPVNPFRDDQGA